uniref:Uncharacterized protein n=1 Tax=Brassica oleracea var. oleracea TaxID=109376 RepID=A0A0D3CFE2_BRAOL
MDIRNWDPGNRSGVGDSHRIDHYYLESFEGIRRGYEDFGRKFRSDLGKDLNRKGKLGFKGYWGLMSDLYRIGLRDQRPILFQSKDIRGMRIGSAERLISISRWLCAVKGKGIEGRLRMIMMIGVGISIFVIIKTNLSEDVDFDQGLWWVSSNQPHIDLCCSYFSYTDKPFLEGISERQRWLGSVAIMVWSTKDLVWSSTWLDWLIMCRHFYLVACLRDILREVWIIGSTIDSDLTCGLWHWNIDICLNSHVYFSHYFWILWILGEMVSITCHLNYCRHRGRLLHNGAGDAASIRRQEGDCLVYRDDT